VATSDNNVIIMHRFFLLFVVGDEEPAVAGALVGSSREPSPAKAVLEVC
jgi:hypothetical protein